MVFGTQLKEVAMRFALSRSALAIALSACLIVSTASEEGRAAPPGSAGTSGRPAANAVAPASVAVGLVNHSIRYTGASFATGAVGLRNRSEGGLEVSGFTGPLKLALLYWAVITNGAPTNAQSNVFFRKAGGTFVNIAGAQVGVGQSPCWGGDRTTVYRGVVPSSVANGNGQYNIVLRVGASGSTAGQNPWVSSPLPLVEGASLVMIGTGGSTVSVYDVGLGGRMFFNFLTYQLNSVSVANATEVLVHNIGADGQIGTGLSASSATAGETTTLNGQPVAGPNSPANDSDWNGAVAGPLPQLWDNTTHFVTYQARAGATPTRLPFVVNAPDDCLVTVANIVSVR
jgi:hypothetical protein